MDDKKQQETDKNQTTSTNVPKTRRARKPRVTKKSVKSEAEEKVSVTGSKSSEHATTLEDSVKLLEEIGLKKVSNKTFINENDLAAFLHKDFTNINKAKALGFIQILQREYPVDLSELKAAYIAYYHENKPKENGNLFVRAPETESKDWKKYLIWILIAFLLALGGWYLFIKDTSNHNITENSDNMVISDTQNPVIKEAKKNLQTLEKTKPKDTVISVPANNITIATGNNTNIPENDLDLDTMVKEMIEENNISITEPLQTEDQNSTDTTKKIENKTDLSEPNNSASALKNSSKKSVDHKEKKIKTKIEPKKTFTQKKEYSSTSSLYIEPTKKAWIGIIYLDTLKKKDFLVRNKFKLDPNRAQLIVVGHKFFEIFNNGYSFRFRGRGPVRFIYKDGNIMEINQKEFLEYSKGVNW